MALGSPELILDLSRLLARVMHGTPTGVDRVEMAYAEGLLEAAGDRLHFAAVHPIGVYGRLPHDVVLKFLQKTTSQWKLGEQTPDRLRALKMLSTLRPRTTSNEGAIRPRVYIQSSPHHLTNAKLVRSILQREKAGLLCFIHDLIPITHPEYARPDGADQHRKRIDTILQNAAGIAANSRATLEALRFAAPDKTLNLPTRVAHLGTESFPPSTSERDDNYFVCIGTIEPRKNHLLLLNIWRKLVEESGGERIAKLILVGRRGWENEQVVDMLERCNALVEWVEEHNNLPDGKMRALLGNARALLLPSFAEGYGMPVTEALNMGVPVICSDLAALREVGGNVPEFLDPLDGPGWIAMIRDYAAHSSASRAAQIQRMGEWRAPTWAAHIATVLDLADEVSQ